MEGREAGAEYYDHVFNSSPDFRGAYKDSRYYVLWTQVVQFVRRFPSPRILEIGCGTGQLSRYLYDEGYRDYHGFDFSAKAIELAQKSSEQSFEVANALDPGAYWYDYNLVIATEVLEHIRDDWAVLERLREGTPIIITLPVGDMSEPSHLRMFHGPRDITKRYYRHIHFHKIVQVESWFVCLGILGRFKPSFWQRLAKTRSEVNAYFIFRKAKSLFVGR